MFEIISSCFPWLRVYIEQENKANTKKSRSCARAVWILTGIS